MEDTHTCPQLSGIAASSGITFDRHADKPITGIKKLAHV